MATYKSLGMHVIMSKRIVAPVISSCVISCMHKYVRIPGGDAVKFVHICLNLMAGSLVILISNTIKQIFFYSGLLPS